MDISGGFSMPSADLIVLTGREIYGWRKLRRPEEPTYRRGFSLLGQRSVFDSSIFQNLVASDAAPLRFAGWKPAPPSKGDPFTLVRDDARGPLRGFPRGMDLMAAAGNPKAAELLADRYRLLALDYLGTGDSDKPKTGFRYTIQEQADLIAQMIHVAAHCPQHTFQWLTRYPERYASFRWPDNCWLGATATTRTEAVEALARLKCGRVRFLSCEPLLRWDHNYCAGLYELNWLIIGAMSGPGAIPPAPGSVERLIEAADRAGVPVWCKRSVWNVCKRQEWPRKGDDAG
jgi:hypothetical protein